MPSPAVPPLLIPLCPARHLSAPLLDHPSPPPPLPWPIAVPVPVLQRRLYDQTGLVAKSADQEFAEGFAGGSFRDPLTAAAAVAAGGGSAIGNGGGGGGGSMADQIILRHQSGEFQSHSAGFEVR